VTSSANVGHELVNRSSSGDVKRFVLSCQRWSFACTRVASNRNDGRLEARLLWVCYVCVQEKRGCLGAYALHPNIGYCMSVCSRALRVISALTIERIRSGREREREHPPRQLDKSMEHSWIRHESASRYCRASHVETAVHMRNEFRRNRQTGTE